MKAIHTFWSAPNRARHGGSVVLEDYELLTMMLSALKWRERNGPVVMLTDGPGRAYLENAGLASLWSEPIDASLDGMEPRLDPVRFWAAGKLEALRRESGPCVLLDTDLIVWENVDALLRDAVVAAHPEALEPSIYPDPAAVFTLDKSYAFPGEWDFTLPAVNTAFLYMPPGTLRQYYTDEAFRFMRALRDTDADTSVTMCFAEQRLLPMCAKARGVDVRTLFAREDADTQRLVTHLWGGKDSLARSAAKRIEYCLGCALRILTDFPAWEGVLAANGLTRRYLLHQS